MNNSECFEDNFKHALSRSIAAAGSSLPPARFILHPDNSEFIASAQPLGNGVELIISKGVIATTQALWHDAKVLSDSLPEESQLDVSDVEQAIDASLQWLILHELHHFQMDHFQLVGGQAISETSTPPPLGLTSRSSKKPILLDALDRSERLPARRCLELQADHDATEMLVDGYSTDGWPILRFYAASIFAMMVLIEQQEPIQDDDAREYPKAATRIFQMLGYLSTMWMVPAMLNVHRLGLDQPRPPKRLKPSTPRSLLLPLPMPCC